MAETLCGSPMYMVKTVLLVVVVTMIHSLSAMKFVIICREIVIIQQFVVFCVPVYIMSRVGKVWPVGQMQPLSSVDPARDTSSVLTLNPADVFP